MRTTMTHTDGMAFQVLVDGHSFTVDAAPEHGGEDLGPRPKPLLLAALGGCTAMDVVSILNKMRQTWTRFEVHTDAELTETHPKVFSDYTVTFEIDGPVDPVKLWRAVALSRDRYCGVSAILREQAPVTVRVVLNGEELPESAAA